MRIFRPLTIIITLIFCGLVANASPAKLYQYGTKVKLEGLINRQTFPGPPNYEDIKKGDIPETYWILNLIEPINVQGINNDDLSSPQKNIKKIQLILNASQYKRWEHLLSTKKKIIVIGTLFSRHTGHHHTAVLMTVDNCI